jgi:hypothetical protein
MAAPRPRRAKRRVDAAFLVDPALRCLEAILKDPDQPQVLRAIQVVLDRNELYGYGVEHQAAGPTRARVTTPVKAVSAIHVQSPSDDQFAPSRPDVMAQDVGTTSVARNLT